MADFGVKLVNPFDLLENDTAEADVPEEVQAPVKPKPPVRLPKPSEKPGQLGFMRAIVPLQTQ
jgi:hypothetical protein